MKVPYSWLREYVPVSASAEEVAARLAVSTAEVERVSWRGVNDSEGNFDHFRVGRVLEAGKHPNADRLQLCKVDVGEAEPRQIVCGAWNFGAGATVPVGLPGAVVPGGMKLERVKLRGSISEGMIMSERELELGQDHSGIMLLPDGLEPGTPLADVFALGEPVMELEVTGNRPDLLAVYGLAREIAALYSLELAPPPGIDPEPVADEPVQIEIEDFAGCPRYVGRLFRDVKIGPSPPWLKARLTGAGMRPISNVVDITNYVMLALGNPLHAFDLERLAEHRIVVRRARPDEQMRTLDGVDRKLDPRDLVIADAKTPVAIAGIMGGEESEVADESNSILLESANFEPVGILESSERLKLRTEGSNRWEKGVDPYLAEQAAKLATELMVKLSGGRWVGQIDVQGDLPERPLVSFRPERADELIGVTIPPEEQRGLLERFGFEVAADWTVTVPSFRARDVTREVDLVEEIARVHLDEVPFTLPRRRAMWGRLAREQSLRRRVEDVLCGMGFVEAYTYSLVDSDPDPQAIRLPEPLTAEHSLLRTTIVEGLIRSLQRNLDAGNEEIALFEIAHVYLPGKEELPAEPVRVAGLTWGGFSRAKGAVETLFRQLAAPEPRFEPVGELPFLHPLKAAKVGAAGWLGELHPELAQGEWGLFELDLGALAEVARDVIVYRDVISFPAVKQDLSFVVAEGTPAGAIIAAAHEAAGPELQRMDVTDVYRGPQVGEGKKSVTFAVAFQSAERTLSDVEATALRGEIVRALAERFGAALRS
ncbi:MAG: phenylalanine--tRNA ligase subunit beta [Gaiellaceae bacterium]|jgi:phenylalanyl-tRNA synthetase beta chain